jgi:hypothetical protein
MAEVIREVTLEREQQSAIKMRARAGGADTKTKRSVFEILRDKTAKSKRLKQQMKRFEKPKYYAQTKTLVDICTDDCIGSPSSVNICFLLLKLQMRWITRQTSGF